MGESAWYITVPSGLQQSPFEIATPLMCSIKPSCGSRQYSAPFSDAIAGSSTIVPTQKRPMGSILPSLKRSPSASVRAWAKASPAF